MGARLTERVAQISHPERWALAGLTLVAALLRFMWLDSRGFWEDEVKTVLLLRLDFVDMITRVAETEATPHLYYVLAWVWTRAFGDGEVGLRALSAVVGTLTVPVVYAAAARLLSIRAGLVAAALTAVSPLLVWHAQDARSYALLGLLTAVALLFFVRALDGAGDRDVLWWGVSSVLALATHYFALFVIAPMAVWLLVRGPLGRRRVVAVGAVALTGALLIPLARYQLRTETSSETGTGPDAIEQVTIARRLLQAAAQFLVGPQPDLQRLSAAAAGFLVLVAIALVATRAGRRERRAAGVALAVGGAAILVPVVLGIAGVDFVLARNLLPAWAPLAIGAAAGLGASRAGRLGPGVAAALCLLSVGVVVSTATEPKFEREDWRGAADMLGSPDGTPRAILVSPDDGAETLLFYRPKARALTGGGVRVREVVVIGMPERDHALGESPRPPPAEELPAPGPGFAEVERQEASFFTLVRFRARESTVFASVGRSSKPSDSPPAVFFEPAA